MRGQDHCLGRAQSIHQFIFAQVSDRLLGQQFNPLGLDLTPVPIDHITARAVEHKQSRTLAHRDATV